MTVVLAADETGALARAAAALDQGAVIGVPTDTVYGLVCLCSDAAAIDRLFAVKERPAEKALPVLLGDVQQARAVVEGPLPPPARLLMERYWPGPLTLVLPAQPHLPTALTAGKGTVGVRLPAQPFLQALARCVGPLASSSANRSGAPPCANRRGRAGAAGRPHPPARRCRTDAARRAQHGFRPERRTARTAAAGSAGAGGAGSRLRR